MVPSARFVGRVALVSTISPAQDEHVRARGEGGTSTHAKR